MPTVKPPVPLQPTPAANVATNRGRRAWSFLAELVHEVWRQPVSMLAKQAAYSLLYAIPSILIVVVALSSVIDKQFHAGTSATLKEFIDDRAPSELKPLLNSLVDEAFAKTSQGTATVTATVSLVIALWGGSGAAGALIYACNLVYDVQDSRSWVHRTVLKLSMMVVGGIGVVLGFVLFAFGRRIGQWIAGETRHASLLVDLLTSARGWSLALVAGSLLLLYVTGPDVDKSIRWLVPGTAIATLAVAVTFAGLSLVLEVWNPGNAYGAAGSVLILLWSLYVLSLIVVVGAVINAVVARRFDRAFTSDLGAHPNKRRLRQDHPD